MSGFDQTMTFFDWMQEELSNCDLVVHVRAKIVDRRIMCEEMMILMDESHVVLGFEGSRCCSLNLSTDIGR